MRAPGEPELRRELAAIGLRAERRLLLRRFVATTRATFVAAAPLSIALATLGLAVHLAQRALGVDVVGIPGEMIFALVIAPVPALFASRALPVLFAKLDARDGLAELDAARRTGDRLRSAHEFLGTAPRSVFEQAAIEDALDHVVPAREHEFAPAQGRGFPRRAAGWFAAALVVAFLAALAKPPTDEALGGADTKVALIAPVGDPTRARTAGDENARPPANEPPRETSERAHAAAASANRTEERPARAEFERTQRESSGQSGAGQSSQASPATQSSDSQGLPSSQAQPSTSNEPAKTAAKKPKTRPKSSESGAPKKKPPQESGSTAGRGVGSGSSKNPGATDWASKDQVSNDDEPPLADDEEVDDESDESEARGGLQPSLRDRRPAANRDLTIGFGNEPNPDANGRGGPSEQKKSRGVASLVLGVPIPDHVKGPPNPGRTKITQERVQPRAEDAAAIEAAARRAREDAIGPVARPALEPWMRALVKSYFKDVPNTPPRKP